MPEQPPNPENPEDKIPPSTLFLEMMRQAAAERRTEEAHEAHSDDDEGANQTEADAEALEAADDAAKLPETPPGAEAENIPEAAAEQDDADEEDNHEDDEDAITPDATPPDVQETPPAEQSYAAPPDFQDAIPDTQPIESDVASANISKTESARRAAAMEQQRIRRIKRRRERRRRKRAGFIGGFVRTAFITFMAGILVSTIFTWFTSPDFIQQDVVSGLQYAAINTRQPTESPTSLPTPNWLRRIGIVAGHRGPENDPGAVCIDENGEVYLTEAEINFDVAQRVVQNLRALGYSVDLLDEFDPRLADYQAAALLSIHSNSHRYGCNPYPDAEEPTGFIIAKASARPEGGEDTRLAECVALYYQQTTSLERRFSLTLDMTDYHSFREIHPNTPAAIIELGFMWGDQALLTEKPDTIAQGLTNGLQCYLAPGVLPTPVFTPVPSPTP